MRGRYVVGALLAAAVGGTGVAAYTVLTPRGPVTVAEQPVTVQPQAAPVPVHEVAPPPSAPLAEGARGPEVLAAQKVLADQGYQVREVNGVFDTETRHAVIAFQKVHELERTGIIEAATAAALRHPVRPVAQARKGFRVEVDLAKQVTYFLDDNGAIERIYDSSTGRDQPGKHTPAGEFAVTRQINGWRHAPLGPMWRPSYIGQGGSDQGIAFHGGEPVETWPASNGCIRMTDASVNETFALLRVGTKVLVHP
ncbi:MULTISPECIES: L,D-transpeptidase family protein [unclassified Crossiella]|uniref:L,D-transpeptidase family protein n=1 Tax=unclassified Crossiella TaxID=2620835 RepID=UPI001FFF6994|nr:MULTISPECIES: L,D-transpeptidase family protein [unclassified Crossiella]MCK2245342.1 L,D-transpeptidase family protein [Crossiella sp. S99.2]MCK2258956.1 L,D-transpeptidase family protein [Crossiella sp. S99.1]